MKQPLARWAPGVLLAWGSLGICLVVSEDTGTEGLSSTSLVDFTTMSLLESPDSNEKTNLEVPEPHLFPSALQVLLGSGFASEEENEDFKILQSKIFWEDRSDNDSSLYLGPASDSSLPLASQKARPKGNRTQTKDDGDTPTHHQSSDSLEPDSATPSISTVEEEEGLLPINQSNGTPQSSQRPKATASEAAVHDSLYSLLLSTVASRRDVGTEVAMDRQEEESAPEHFSSSSDLGSSMGSTLLPLATILSATPSAAPEEHKVSFKIALETTADTEGAGGDPVKNMATVATVEADIVQKVEAVTGGERPKPMVGTGLEQADSRAGTVATESTEIAEMNQTGEDPITSTHGYGIQGTETVSKVSGSPPRPRSSVPFWDWTDKPAPTPASTQNNTKLLGHSSAPQSGDARMAVLSTDMPWNLPQVTCRDWSNLAGKNYIILNMSDNIDCEEFRLERGPQLLALMEDAFSRYENGLQGQWLISLSKPNENDKHLLMTLAGENGVVPTNDVLLALGDMRRSLAEIGIQNYTTTTSCQSRPSQSHSDYGKLFVVLVIIGSICVIIIIMGLIYNCWQRRLPKMKNMSHGEELRFVENGCHDNPTLDVASDSQSEMQEKKPSVNGGGAINGPEGWDILIDKQAGEEGDAFEEDTHL